MDERTFNAVSTAPDHSVQGKAQSPLQALSLALLSANEVALMRWLAGGHTNTQIGICTHRSEKTVRNQLTRLYAKLGASNRAEAVAIYMRMGGT